jgi:hypothetical protein
MANAHANRSSSPPFRHPAARALVAFVASMLVVALVGGVLPGAAGRRTAAAATGTAAPGFPWAAMPPPDARTHEVLAVGDSLMGNTLTELVGIATEATFRDEHRNASGLVSPIILDPFNPDTSAFVAPDVFVNLMMDKWPNADTVFVEWAGACATPCTYAYGSREFYDAWWAMARTIRDEVLARGKTLVWAISPPTPSSNTSTTNVAQNVADRLSWDSRTQLQGTPRADMWIALAADDGFLGRYAQWLNYFFWPVVGDHQVRADDLVHLTPDGAFRTAYWSTIGLRQAWASTSGTSTPTTTTTTTTSTTTTAPPTTTVPPTTTTAPPKQPRGKKPR